MGSTDLISFEVKHFLYSQLFKSCG